jgi:Cof subfamily protein (haloacid dehalogenase superfamily)
MSPLQLDHLPEIKLIACDLDGTLLDDAHAIHDDFWPLIDQLYAKGIIFCPASGRQYQNLLEQFRRVADEMIFIAENGAYVMRAGVELSSDCLTQRQTHDLVRTARGLTGLGANAGTVLCGKRSAYVERTDAVFLDQVGNYCHCLEQVGDLLTVEDDILKVSVFEFEEIERIVAPAFAHYRQSLQVVVSGQHWIDIMGPGVNKGVGIRRIQQALQISRDETMVFGDFLNDLEMMDEARYSFAMENAHPGLKARARYLAPRNTDNGVVRTLRSVLGIG